MASIITAKATSGTVARGRRGLADTLTALMPSAASLQAVLTPDNIAISRAANAMMKLDATVEKMREY